MHQSPTVAPDRQDTRALAILFGIVFINLVGFGLVVPLLPFFGRSLHAEAWQVALMFAAYSLGQFFGEPVWGRLSDRIGRKPVLLFTVTSNIVGYLCLAFAPNIWAAIVIRLISGLGAGNISTVQGYVADVSPPEKRAGRMGLIGAAFGAGFIAGPALTGLLVREDMGRLGYQLPIFAASALSALAALGVLFLLKESVMRRTEAEMKRPPFLGGVAEAAGNPVVSQVIMATLIYTAGFSAMESTFGLWTGSRYGWGAREVAYAFMSASIVAALCQGALTGRLVKRFGESRVLASGCLLFGMGLTGQLLSKADWTVPIALAVGGFGMALIMPNISAMISKATASDRQGAMLGLNMAASSSGRIIGPIAAGFMFSHLGHDWPLAVSAALTLPAAFFALRAGRAADARRATPEAAMA